MLENAFFVTHTRIDAEHSQSGFALSLGQKRRYAILRPEGYSDIRE